MNTIAPRSEPNLKIPLEEVSLIGDFIAPENAIGTVIFAHGSGSSRKSSRNRLVARHLQTNGIGTLLFDLLTEDEEQEDMHTGHLRFNIRLLSRRLTAVTRWFLHENGSSPLGYFGASTGAAAALNAAAELQSAIHCVVSRGGRPDLAGLALRQVTSATLLIVGGEDHPVIDLNKKALAELRCEKRMEIIPGATHLFEEPGTLEQAASLASRWFEHHFQLVPGT